MIRPGTKRMKEKRAHFLVLNEQRWIFWRKNVKKCLKFYDKKTILLTLIKQLGLRRRLGLWITWGLCLLSWGCPRSAPPTSPCAGNTWQEHYTDVMRLKLWASILPLIPKLLGLTFEWAIKSSSCCGVSVENMKHSRSLSRLSNAFIPKCTEEATWQGGQRSDL